MLDNPLAEDLHKDAIRHVSSCILQEALKRRSLTVFRDRQETKHPQTFYHGDLEKEGVIEFQRVTAVP